MLRGISKSQDKQVCQGECRFLGILQREKDLPSANLSHAIHIQLPVCQETSPSPYPTLHPRSYPE